MTWFWIPAFAGMTVLIAMPLTADMSRAVLAIEEQRWTAAMDELIGELEQNPRNAEARSYVTLVARQIANSQRADRREQRLALLEESSKHLEANRQDAAMLQAAIVDTTQAEQRARDERLRLRVEEARMKRESGQLLAANDLILQVIAENSSYAEAQRELSEVQIRLREALDRGGFGSIVERYAYEGFYAYGQADYEGAVTAWRKARAILTPDGSSQETMRRLSAYRFGPYEKLAQAAVDDQKRVAQVRRLFDQAMDLYKRGQFTQALEAFRQVAIHDPEYPLLGHYLVKAEAEAEKERIARIGEQRLKEVQMAMQKGMAALMKENYSESIGWFEKAVSLDPSHAQARSYLATAKSDQQRRHDPKAAQARYEAGLVAYASGKLDEAAREWRMALRLSPEHAKAQMALTKVQKELAMNQELP
jgi:tetratricopeptide (TPR) repeat protein